MLPLPLSVSVSNEGAGAASGRPAGGRGGHQHTFYGAAVVTYDLGGHIVSLTKTAYPVTFTPGPWVNYVHAGYEVTDTYRSSQLPDTVDLVTP